MENIQKSVYRFAIPFIMCHYSSERSEGRSNLNLICLELCLICFQVRPGMLLATLEVLPNPRANNYAPSRLLHPLKNHSEN